MLNDSHRISFFSFYLKTVHRALLENIDFLCSEIKNEEVRVMGSFQVYLQLWYKLFFISCLPLLFLSWDAVRLSPLARGYVLWIRLLLGFSLSGSDWLRVVPLVHRHERVLSTGWWNPICVFPCDVNRSFSPRNGVSLLCSSMRCLLFTVCVLWHLYSFWLEGMRASSLWCLHDKGLLN